MTSSVTQRFHSDFSEGVKFCEIGKSARCCANDREKHDKILKTKHVARPRIIQDFDDALDKAIFIPNLFRRIDRIYLNHIFNAYIKPVLIFIITVDGVMFGSFSPVSDMQ